jgi:hypothetical protein
MAPRRHRGRLVVAAAAAVGLQDGVGRGARSAARFLELISHRQGHRPGSFPVRDYGLNKAWLDASMTACILLSWLRHLALDGIEHWLRKDKPPEKVLIVMVEPDHEEPLPVLRKQGRTGRIRRAVLADPRRAQEEVLPGVEAAADRAGYRVFRPILSRLPPVPSPVRAQCD